MIETQEIRAWIERAGLPDLPVTGSCSIGRASANQLVVQDDKVSRKHAVIHRQGENQYWLVDLGSSNGTYLNGRRVAQPVGLEDGATIQIGACVMRFRLRNPAGFSAGETAERTVVDIRSADCWLLLADIEGSTRLAQAVSAEQLAVITGLWFRHCKQVIEGQGGTINKYLGDGFLAYWTAAAADGERIREALAGLRTLQDSGQPSFRVVLHRGIVSLGGTPSMGEESLAGPAVNFAFRIEKVAGALAQPRVASRPAAEALGPGFATGSLGDHTVTGFSGSFELFSF